MGSTAILVKSRYSAGPSPMRPILFRNFPLGVNLAMPSKSRKTKSDGREKRKAIFEAKTKCAQKSRLLPPSGQNTSVVQTPFESCLNDAFLLNFLLKYHLKPIANLAKNRIFT